ncbi:MAG: hypothetical protein RIS76_3500 [Verrucomicrobiota bacterium]
MKTRPAESCASIYRGSIQTVGPRLDMPLLRRSLLSLGAMAGAVALLLVGTSLHAADEPYNPTDDVGGGGGALDPKSSVPEPEGAMAIMAVTAVALLGGARLVKVVRFRK